MDWSDMLEEVLVVILSKVFGKDRLTFSLVCRSWNKALTTSPYSPSPCLVFPNRGNHIWRVFKHNVHFSMNFSMNFPDQSAAIRCSKHGWLLISRDDRTLFFFDPFNHQKIEVPNPHQMHQYTTLSFFHPPTSPECFIVGIESPPVCPVEICILRHGEDEWKRDYFDASNKFEASLARPILHDGKLYFLDARGNIATIDMKEDIGEGLYVYSKCFKQRRSRRNIKEHYLVKCKGDDTIFGVFVMHADRKVKVFRLLENCSNCSWEKVDDLGDMVFYVSNTSSFGYKCDNKSTKNKIFFSRFCGEYVAFYSLDTQKYHSFQGDYSSENSYGLRKFDLAAWMMPTTTLPLSRELLAWCPQEASTIS